MSWWATDSYERPVPLPDEFYETPAPKGLALVKVNSDGTTQAGWGALGGKDPKTGVRADGFMPRYMRGEFLHRRALHRYHQDGSPFAIVMRAQPMLCVDIDGKNGGLEHAKELGLTIATLAETSKSGNGYHLFYSTPEEWDDEHGFGKFADAIGIVQGVDIRGAGCVYHYSSQRWNNRSVAPLPPFLEQKLTDREQKRQHGAARITAILSTTDDLEKIMLHDELITDLKKPIRPGMRNQTLFAIGSKMKLADVPDWDRHVTERGEQIGLDAAELDKIVSNIETYAA